MTPKQNENTGMKTDPAKAATAVTRDAAPSYVPPRIITHSAEELENALPRVTACVSFVGP